MTRTFSVSQLNNYISDMLNEELFITDINITGEISSMSFSGKNTFFELTDSFSSIKCVYFNSRKRSLSLTSSEADSSDFPFKSGDSVSVNGSPALYQKTGTLSFKVAAMTAHGAGDKHKALAELKERLTKEGVFDKCREKPQFINKIAVVSSADGAVIHDILSVTKRRNPNVSIALFPCKVQGKDAELEICQAINDINLYLPEADAIIIARGGGSEEDLSCFNTECIARAVYNSKLFIISAVGHETDYTLCDFAADIRTPTPSAAAEYAVSLISNDYNRLFQLAEKCRQNFGNILKTKVARFRNGADRVNRLIENGLYSMESRTRSLTVRCTAAVNSLTENKDSSLKVLDARISTLNPLKLISGGYAKIVKNHKAISGINELSITDTVSIYMSDGVASAVIQSKKEKI